jgi:hypothetical protein
MDKNQINDILRNIGLQNVTVHGIGYNSRGTDEKVYKVNDKMVKGIRGGSIGPMTMTTAYLDHNKNVVTAISREFDTHIVTANGIICRVKISDKVTRQLTFNWQLFPTNSAAKDLDPGYKTYWLTLNAEDIKS